MDTQTCTKCGTSYPASREFFYGCTSRSNGLHSWCKGCFRASVNAAYAENPEPKKARERKRREEHPEYMANYNRQYYAEHRDELGARNRTYYLENKEQFKASNRAWREANPGRCRVIHDRRRGRTLSADGCFTQTDVIEQLRRQSGRCYWCGERLPRAGWHVDHVVPLARGGSNGADNIVIAHKHCNLSKKDKMPHEFVPPDGQLRLA